MAFSATPHRPQLLRLPRGSSSSSRPLYSIHFRPSRANLNLRRSLSVQSSSVPAAPSVAPAISLTDNALKHLNKMRSDRGQDLCLRIGVKQGGCSGMSYAMDFEDRAKTRPDDSVVEFNGFVMGEHIKELERSLNETPRTRPVQLIVCDPKSLLFLYGMQLDFSDALIGGGFTFKNPNATQTCGCGTSFAAEM